MPLIKHLQQHKIILDTHVWIWLMEGNPELSPQFRKAVERCQEHEAILISAISVWEIGMLVDNKRISFEMDCLDWIEQALSARGIRLCPITPRIAIQSTRLPGSIHADPADRLLLASALEESAVLVTCDEKLLEYGKGRFLSVHDPR